MKSREIIAIVLSSVISLSSCSKQDKQEMKTENLRTIKIDQLRDKIAGGWAGKMIGVAYGAPTEFRAQGKLYEEEIKWEPSFVRNSLRQDDIYVQLSFMMTMDKHGIDAPAEKFAESFATAGYRLWHANVQARKNFFDGIMPPASGSPEYNLHADDIDFQIESDYIGFMCPGLPQTAIKIADKVGHVMNYGDGVYGGMFVAALYTEAFFETDIHRIIDRALLSIPAESDYAKCIKDVIALYGHYPADWRAAWQELERKWGDVDICGALQPFNIDAKLNGAYIVMGLLYGEGDFEKTMEISTRCGQDSDCNPSNAAAVIGVIKGYSGIPEKWKSGIEPVADSLFIFTNYTFNSAVENTVKYARQLVLENGGIIEGNIVKIKIQEPVAPPLEVSFPDVVPDYKVSVFEGKSWNWKGNWKVLTRKSRESGREIPQARYSDESGAEMIFTFEGTGVVIRGGLRKDGGKADVYVDGKLHRTFDTYFWWANQEKSDAFLWHILNREPGKHTVRLVVKGEKRTESEGARICITGATVFKTGLKKNETVKLSFER
ncbi:MAG TPA: ADP-ribosylglycohydrolase family protein [bacterium]|nr:ADP-ribosylglycohydrolase family protein [bacterium]